MYRSSLAVILLFTILPLWSEVQPLFIPLTSDELQQVTYAGFARVSAVSTEETIIHVGDVAYLGEPKKTYLTQIIRDLSGDTTQRQWLVLGAVGNIRHTTDPNPWRNIDATAEDELVLLLLDGEGKPVHVPEPYDHMVSRHRGVFFISGSAAAEIARVWPRLIEGLPGDRNPLLERQYLYNCMHDPELSDQQLAELLLSSLEHVEVFGFISEIGFAIDRLEKSPWETRKPVFDRLIAIVGDRQLAYGYKWLPFWYLRKMAGKDRAQDLVTQIRDAIRSGIQDGDEYLAFHRHANGSRVIEPGSTELKTYMLEMEWLRSGAGPVGTSEK